MIYTGVMSAKALTPSHPGSCRLIIGLGNPDSDYEQTFHNAGFLMIDALTRSAKAPQDTTVIKSAELMNNSGRFVRAEIKKAGLAPEQLLLIHDDSDIALGACKFSFGRSSAGHRGVQNVIDQLGTNHFWRLRIGIRPSRNKSKADVLVLKKIPAAQRKRLDEVFQQAIAFLWPQ